MVVHFQRDGRRVCAVLQAPFCGRRWDMRTSFGEQQVPYDRIVPDRTSKLIPVCTSWLMALHSQAAMPGQLAVLADGVLG